MITWILVGLTLGCIYALIAIGFVILYKAMGLLNFAHLSFLLFGAYLTYSFIAYLEFPFLFAALISVLIVSLIGILIQATMLNHLIGKSIHAMIMICLALGMILNSISGAIWGYNNKNFPAPVEDKLINILGGNIPAIHLYMILFTVILFILLMVFFRYTAMGIQFRAAADSQEGAMLSGIDVKRVYLIAWVLSAATGCFAGIIAANIQVMDQNLGFIAIKSFPVMVLGGMTSVAGPIVAGPIVGLIEMATGWYLGQLARDIVPYFLLFVILLVKPYGLFGEEEIERL
jgi:branched-chain amino acid transport system permease protein